MQKNIYRILMLMTCWPIYAMDGKIIGFAQPDDPNACVPEIIYHSPFQDYQPHGPIKLQSWLKANESVTNQPMQHMNMPMEGSQSDAKESTQHSNHQMKESK
jgi:hypothetical protein